MSSKKPSLADGIRKGLVSETKALTDRFARADAVMALQEAKNVSHQDVANGPPESLEPPRTLISVAQQPAPKATVTRLPRPKVTRRTFTLTVEEHQLLKELKRRCNFQGFEAPQSELVRAGLHLLAKQDERQLKAALDSVIKLQPGRESELDD